MNRRSERFRQGLAIAALLAFAATTVIMYDRIGKPMTELVRDTERFSAWVEELGWKSRLVFIAMVCFQVIVAIIPGEPLEMAAGFVFGAVEGTLLCIAGILLGSVIVFGMVRVFGKRMVLLFFSQEKLDSLNLLKNRKRLFVTMTVLMLLPGTPKDLLTYAAGLTPVSFGLWMLLSSVGRLPSVVTSTWGGHAVGEGRYIQAAVIFGVTLLLCCAGLYIFGRMKRKKDAADPEEKRKYRKAKSGSKDS